MDNEKEEVKEETTNEKETETKESTDDSVEVEILGNKHKLTKQEHSQLLLAGVQKIREMREGKTQEEAEDTSGGDAGDEDTRKQEEKEPGEDAPEKEQIAFLRKQMRDQEKRFQDQITQMDVNQKINSTKQALEALLDSNEVTKQGKARNVVARLTLLAHSQNPKISLADHFKMTISEIEDLGKGKSASYIKGKLEDGEKTRGEKGSEKQRDAQKKEKLDRKAFKSGGIFKRAMSRLQGS